MDVKGTNGGQIEPGWRFGLRWALLTVAGWTIGFPVSFALGETLLGYVGLETCLVAVVSLMQWLVLRRFVRRAGFWAPAGIIGFAVSSSIHTVVCYVWKLPFDMGIPLGVLVWTMAFAVGGTLTGLLQQRILRRQVRRSAWWVPASAAGWGLGMIGFGIPFRVLPRSGPFMMLLIRNLVLPSVLASVLLGIITGGTLIWLLRQPTQIEAS
jgi:hypothetical protein